MSVRRRRPECDRGVEAFGGNDGGNMMMFGPGYGSSLREIHGLSIDDVELDE
ncbi:hypothetical protein HPP92_024753 [Vanilla planifolia]|uniref:Uncharacterized protein n=1 Tax=Vanilla planifolia TaxID=51239 RepID=A0A835PNJ5_VANPL|nr:hypothetical protein HPP92_024753 [Vanilla planifolia]